MSVADLLRLSREAHQRYRDAVPRRVPQGPEGGATVAVDGDTSVAREALFDAYSFRVEAHAADPAQTDPAWRDEPVTHDHDDLLAFYVEQLAR